MEADSLFADARRAGVVRPRLLSELVEEVVTEGCEEEDKLVPGLVVDNLRVLQLREVGVDPPREEASEFRAGRSAVGGREVAVEGRICGNDCPHSAHVRDKLVGTGVAGGRCDTDELVIVRRYINILLAIRVEHEGEDQGAAEVLKGEVNVGVSAGWGVHFVGLHLQVQQGHQLTKGWCHVDSEDLVLEGILVSLARAMDGGHAIVRQLGG
jgi:hypothetical protein